MRAPYDDRDGLSHHFESMLSLRPSGSASKTTPQHQHHQTDCKMDTRGGQMGRVSSRNPDEGGGGGVRETRSWPLVHKISRADTPGAKAARNHTFLRTQNDKSRAGRQYASPPLLFERVSRSASPSPHRGTRRHCHHVMPGYYRLGASAGPRYYGYRTCAPPRRMSMPPWNARLHMLSGRETQDWNVCSDVRRSLDAARAINIQDYDELHVPTQAVENPCIAPNHRSWSDIFQPVYEQARASCMQWLRNAWLNDGANIQTCLPFVCPFLLSDPQNHLNCLVDGLGEKVSDVKRHIDQVHTQPLYCPVCFDTFPLASQREVHILKRTCEKKDIVEFHGISQEQKLLLSTIPGDLSDTAHWRAIWSIVFGDYVPILDPHLPPQVCRLISLVEEFWKVQGYEATKRLLVDQRLMESDGLGSSSSIASEDHEEAVEILGNEVFKHLLAYVFQRSLEG